MSRVARKVYVISDLHIGGAYPVPGSGDTRGFRLNTHVPELTGFVQRLIATAVPGVALELVINGDIVDFLAEASSTPPTWVPFSPDPDEACRKLETIVTRDRPFFDALGALLKAGHRLTLLLGNHDIELGLPPVQTKFKALLGIDGHADYEFIANDQAYVIGDTVLVEHGNRYDGFNMVDYNSLRNIAALMSRRQEAKTAYTFEAPPGSKMVAWVINPIKEQYRFVDLLMPENGAVVPLLLALEPGTRDLLAKVAVLGVEADRDAHGLPALPVLPKTAVATAATSVGRTSGFLQTLEQDLAEIDRRLSGKDVALHDDIDRTLGLSALLTAHKDSEVEARLPALLEAIRGLQGDQTFNRSIETGTSYLRAAQSLAYEGKFQVVTYGHTHLAKKVTLESGGTYFNSGAWVDFMQFPAAIVSGPTEAARTLLRAFVEAVGTVGMMKYIEYQPTYLRFDLDDQGALLGADLYDYHEGADL